MFLRNFALFLFLASAGAVFAAKSQDTVKNVSETGPTLRLAYSHDVAWTNPVDAFMYFVPLTSPTSIITSTQSNTTLNASVTSQHTEQRDGKAYVTCNFRISGEGSYCAFYDPNEMIKDAIRTNKKKAKEYSKLLEWIRLSGPCLGSIKCVGKVVGNEIRMEYIEVCFNRDDTLSSVEVSIYDVPRIDGKYLFDNRTNCRIARINSLKFQQCTDGVPRMSVELASIKKTNRKDSFISGLSAIIANFLSTSTPVAPIGNATMMEFGRALYHKQAAFTFPKAPNFRIEL